METKELSFKNDPKIKDDLISRMDKHIELDNLLQRATGKGGKGCTVWCALNNENMHYGYDHSTFPLILGLPEWLARLQDEIFEGLSEEDSRWFSSEWVRAIPVGKDLEPVKWKFCAFILKENIERVLLLDISDELKKNVVGAIKQCLAVHERSIETGIWDESAAWSAKWSAALSAKSAAWSADSAMLSAKWSAMLSAESALWSAVWSADSAVLSAKWSADSAVLSAKIAKLSAERRAFFKRSADVLIGLLKNT